MDIGDVYQTHNYGKLRIIDQLDPRHVEVLFLNTGYRVTASVLAVIKGYSIRDLLAPKVNSIGFTGVGVYTFPKDRKAYKCWESILYKKTVIREWHNFQHFAAWYYKQDVDGKQLTILGDIASPDTASFLTKAELVTKNNPSQTFEYTDGTRVTTNNKAEFSREHGLDPSAVSRLTKGKQKTHKGWKYVEVSH